MDGIDLSLLTKGVPAPKSGGGLPFKRGVINPWRCISDHELFIFSGGSARMSAGAEDFECPDGSFIIMRPGRSHLSVCLSERVFVRWLHFDWSPGRLPTHTDYLSGPLSKIPPRDFERPAFLGEGMLRGRIAGEGVLELHDRVCAKLSLRTPQARRLAGALFLEELLALLDAPELGSGHDAKPGERLAYGALEKLRALAEKPQREEPPLRKALRAEGVSYEHLERRFKRHFGQSPAKYLAGLRMEKAKELLLETSLGVAEIAEALGYEDPGYFARLFRKRAGLAPGAFRKGARISKALTGRTSD